jgi:hypothetical protein
VSKLLTGIIYVETFPFFFSLIRFVSAWLDVKSASLWGSVKGMKTAALPHCAIVLQARCLLQRYWLVMIQTVIRGA